MELFASLKGQEGAIVFLGNSITERGAWHELLPGKIIMNRGIGGDNTFGVLARLSEVTKYKPKKIFLLIGINDIGRGLPIEVITANYRRIVQRVRAESPKTRLFIQSVLPMNDAILKYDYLKNKKDTVLALNRELKAIAAANGLTYINLHEVFADGKGDLQAAYTSDGIHINPAAYAAWVEYLRTKKFL
jgi:lysophospholipase L1-like esterase